jgi:2,6-dihydroxypseudooxynicotine hydrolase
VVTEHDSTVRSQPAEETAAHLFQRGEHRMLGDGVPSPDLAAMRREIDRFSVWFDRWAALAERYEGLAAGAESAGHLATAGELWWQASLSWQYAQFMWFHDPAKRRTGQDRKVAAYDRAAPNLSPPAQRVAVPFGPGPLPAFFRRPPAAAPGERVPCVILIGGLESTKEESYHFENLLLRRGMATLAFDGPGQGEYAAVEPLGGDFHEATRAVVDMLVERPDVDPTGIAVLGRSLGGFLAPLSAAHDDRLRACVAFGAFFDLRFWEQLPPVPASGFRSLTGIADPAAAEAAIRRAIDLAPAAGAIRCPLYVLHGEQDPLIPVEQAHLTAEAAVNAEVTLVIVPGGDHCGHNQHHLVRPAIADWLADQLVPDRPENRRLRGSPDVAAR